MWALHWWGTAAEEIQIETPENYRPFRYLGPDTWLELPEYKGLSEYKFLPKFEVVSLPPSWPWTLRGIEEKRLEAIA